MNKPMLSLVENAIGASFGPAAEAIPTNEFNAAVKVAALAALMALRTPSDAMIEAAQLAHNSDTTYRAAWSVMIDAAMQGG